MRELNVDKVEITCLKAIFLFDPGMYNKNLIYLKIKTEKIT